MASPSTVTGWGFTNNVWIVWFGQVDHDRYHGYRPIRRGQLCIQAKGGQRHSKKQSGQDGTGLGRTGQIHRTAEERF